MTEGFLATLDRIDKAITRPFYSYSLYSFERIFFIPACWTGLPLCNDWILPFIIWSLQNNNIWFYTLILFFIAAVSFEGWLRGSLGLGWVMIYPLHAHTALILFIYMTDYSSFHYVILYYMAKLLGLSPILVLKLITRRIRPISSKLTKDIHQYPRHPAHRGYLVPLATTERFKAFPSGDICCSVVFSYVAYQLYPSYIVLCYPVVSALGRMYFGAHHFGDLIVGGSLAYSAAVLVFSIKNYITIYTYLAIYSVMIVIFFTKIKGKSKLKAKAN